MTLEVLPAAVLWDLDGTLIDTEPYWMAQERALVESFGGVWTHEDAHALVGNPLLVSAEYIRDHSPVDLDPPVIVERLQAGMMAALTERTPWRPGARELLMELRALDVPCGLVTMSWRPMVDIVLAALPPDTFGAVITGDAVARSKPHPEPYRAGARELSVEPHDCVAIEDSQTGATSAVAAGCRTLAVPYLVPIAPAPGLAFTRTLSGVRAADLHRLTSPPA